MSIKIIAVSTIVMMTIVTIISKCAAQSEHAVYKRQLGMCQPRNLVVQIVGVNEVNEEVVPFSEANQILTEQDMKGNPLTHLITEG